MVEFSKFGASQGKDRRSRKASFPKKIIERFGDDPSFSGFKGGLGSSKICQFFFFFRTQNEVLDNVQFCRLVFAKDIISREPTKKTEIQECYYASSMATSQVSIIYFQHNDAKNLLYFISERLQSAQKLSQIFHFSVENGHAVVKVYVQKLI